MTDEKMFKTDLADRVFDELSATLEAAIRKGGQMSIYDRLFKIFELATHTEVALLTSIPKREDTDTDTKKEHWPKRCWDQACTVCGGDMSSCLLYENGTVEGWCPKCKDYTEGVKG